MFKIEGYVVRHVGSIKVKNGYLEHPGMTTFRQAKIPNGPNGAIFAHFWPFLEVFGQNENV